MSNRISDVFHGCVEEWERAAGAVPFKNRVRVSLWDATHWSNARALQTLLDAAAVSCEGFRRLYTEIISCMREVMTPTGRGLACSFLRMA